MIDKEELTEMLAWQAEQKYEARRAAAGRRALRRMERQIAKSQPKPRPSEWEFLGLHPFIWIGLFLVAFGLAIAITQFPVHGA